MFNDLFASILLKSDTFYIWTWSHWLSMSFKINGLKFSCYVVCSHSTFLGLSFNILSWRTVTLHGRCSWCLQCAAKFSNTSAKFSIFPAEFSTMQNMHKYIKQRFTWNAYGMLQFWHIFFFEMRKIKMRSFTFTTGYVIEYQIF